MFLKKYNKQLSYFILRKYSDGKRITNYLPICHYKLFKMFEKYLPVALSSQQLSSSNYKPGFYERKLTDFHRCGLKFV